MPPGRLLVFGKIRIETSPIFSPQEVDGASGPLRLLRRVMNGLHTTTKQHVLRREMLFAPGDRYDPELLAETERNLRTLGFLNSVKVAAGDTTPDGRVEVLVSARESWSLQTAVAYSLASGGDQRWNVSFSDNNFLGYGVTMGAGVGADENTTFWNLWYRQRRFLGTDFWFGADTSKLEEGHIRSVFLRRPFWAQDDPWGMDLEVWDRNYEKRFYLSNAGPAGIDRRCPASLYALLRYLDKGADLRWQRRVAGAGAGRLWRLGGGVKWTETRYEHGDPAYELSDDRWVNLGWLSATDQPAAREDGRTVQPYLWVHTRGRSWTKQRFILQYGPVEDLALDPVADLKVGVESGGLGTTTADGRDRLRAEGWWQQWVPAGSGILLLRGEAEAETGGPSRQNHRYNLLAGWMGAGGADRSPWLTRIFGEYAHGQGLEGAEALVLGLDRGLRTLEFDGMAGPPGALEPGARQGPAGRGARPVPSRLGRVLQRRGGLVAGRGTQPRRDPARGRIRPALRPDPLGQLPERAHRSGLGSGGQRRPRADRHDPGPVLISEPE